MKFALNKRKSGIISVLLFSLGVWPLFLLADDDEPALVFREDFVESPPATPITQDHVATPDLVLGLHGPGGKFVKKSHHENKKGDPWYVWSGQCTQKWAVSLRPEKYRIDISGSKARFRWRTKQRGQRNLRILIKCPDKKWFVSDQSTPATEDWTESEFLVSKMTWRPIDMKSITAGEPGGKPDLKNVEAIGFTDLEIGKRSAVCSRLDWIAVYGNVTPASGR